MKNTILFIHSAGPQSDTDGSTGLLKKLKAALVSGHTIIAPNMPNPENPSYEEWSKEIGINLSNSDSVILIGHSLGGSVILKYLSEEQPKVNISALYIISSPVWGLDNEWQSNDFKLKKGFEKQLPPIKHIGLFHSKDEKVVPLKHHKSYAELLNVDETKIIPGSSHLFENGLPELVRSIQHQKEQME